MLFRSNTFTRIGKIEPYGYRIAASGVWRSEDTFFIRVHVLDQCIGTIFIQLVFSEDGITTFMKKYEESEFGEWDGFLSGKALTKDRERDN